MNPPLNRSSVVWLVLIRCNLLSLSSGLSTANVLCWLVLISYIFFLFPRGFQLPTFWAGWCSSAISSFSFLGVSTAKLSCWLVFIRCNLLSLSSGVSAGILSRSRVLFCCNLLSLSSGVSAAILSCSQVLLCCEVIVFH